MRTFNVTPSVKNIGKDDDMVQRLNAVDATVQRGNDGKIQTVTLPDADASHPDRSADVRAIMSEFGHSVDEESSPKE